MAFSANPLALSVPDPTFESWLRDSGYLEILDQRTSDLHRISSISAATTATADSNSVRVGPPTVAAAISTGFFLSTVFNYVGVILSLLTLNPFSKLTNEDFSGDTPPWTLGFIGFFDSYSFPSSRSQARMRVTENIKRYCRNYASLFILFFACSLYQIPIALVGLVSSLALWDLFAYCGNRWHIDNYPVTREFLLRLLQCVLLGQIGFVSSSYYRLAPMLLKFEPKCHCSYYIFVQRASCSAICRWSKLCSDDVACLISEADSC